MHFPQVVGLDFAADMLSDAESRQRQQGLPGLERYSTPMRWVRGDATQLPFEDNEFDAATMGYGLRNVDDRPRYGRPACGKMPVLLTEIDALEHSL